MEGNNHLCLTPRSLLKGKLETGVIDLIVGELCNLREKGPGSERLKQLLAFVAKAAQVDQFFSLEFGAKGGFQSLFRLSVNSKLLEQDLELEELVHDAIGAITVASGCTTFPRMPLECTDAEFLKPLLFTFSEPSGKEFMVALRRVPKNMFEGIVNVGYVLWPAGLIQSRWLCRHADTFLKDQDVLEIGAGVGLSGIVASHFSKTVVLSDFNEECLKNLCFNALLNWSEKECEEEAILGFPACRNGGGGERERAMVAKLDWSKLGDNVNDTHTDRDTETDADVDADVHSREIATLLSRVSRKFEIIIGSDIICCAEDVEGVCRVIHAHLAHTSTARCFFVVASGDHRWGVENFIPSLQDSGLDVDFRPLIHSSYNNAAYSGRDRHTRRHWEWAEDTDLSQDDDDLICSGIDEVDYFVWYLIHCRWKRD